MSWAALNGNTEIVKALIKAGAEVDNITNVSTTSPNFCGNFQRIEFVARSGFQQSGDTPLILAATVGNNEICTLLLNAGAKINIQNQVGRLFAYKLLFINQCIIYASIFREGWLVAGHVRCSERRPNLAAANNPSGSPTGTEKQGYLRKDF